MEESVEPNVPRHIFVRGVNWLGDAVMTTPALQRLRERFPRARITLLTPSKLRELWPGHPAVDEVISFSPNSGVWQVAALLRAAQVSDPLHRSQVIPKLDLAIVLPNSPRSAIEMWLARVPQRIGYARPWRNWFLTRAVPQRAGAAQMHKRSAAEIERLIRHQEGGQTSPQQEHEAADMAVRAPDGKGIDTSVRIPDPHHIHDYLQLVASLGCNPEPVAPRLYVAPDEVEAARKKFSVSDGAGPILGLIPGAEYGPAKRWPAESFAAAAKAIREKTHCTWLILGGAGDSAIAAKVEAVLDQPREAVRNLAGLTTLRELMALLRSCDVVLTNDTGPMHVAAAVGVPVVVPFGSTSPELTGPGLPGDTCHALLKSDAPCAPCFLRECPIDFRCMKGIDVERVVDAVLKAVRLRDVRR